MPSYLYRDDDGHEVEAVHGMRDNPKIVCELCGAVMWRVPQKTRVNWNGNRAGQEPAPAVSELIRTAPKRRAEFERMKEQHEREGVTKFDRPI